MNHYYTQTPSISVDTFKTTEMQVVRDYLNNEITTHHFEVCEEKGGIDLDFRRLKIGDFQVCDFSYGNCEVDIRLNQSDEHKIYIVVPLSGHVNISTPNSSFTLKPGSAWTFVTPEATNTHFHDSSCFRNINICLSYETLRKFLSEEFSLPISRRIYFPDYPVKVNSDFRFLLDLTRWLTSRIDPAVSRNLVETSHLTRHMQDTLMSLLVSTMDNSFQEQYCSSHGSVDSPVYVRQAEEYMCANVSEPITVSDIAREVGVATRTLHLGFQKHRNYSVSEFLRDERLQHARKALVTAKQNNLSVTDIAFSYGFYHLSKFAVAYRKKFGEKPSETRQRGS